MEMKLMISLFQQMSGDETEFYSELQQLSYGITIALFSENDLGPGPIVINKNVHMKDRSKLFQYYLNGFVCKLCLI